jgi:aspartate dehydrogenase
VHEIRVEGRAGRIVTVAENLPMRGTPGTSRLAALSIIRLLRNLSEPVYIGA